MESPAPRLLAGPPREHGLAADSSIWAAADAWQRCESVEILEESTERTAVRFTYTAPALPGLRTEITYTVEDTGGITAAVRSNGDKVASLAGTGSGPISLPIWCPRSAAAMWTPVPPPCAHRTGAG